NLAVAWLQAGQKVFDRPCAQNNSVDLGSHIRWQFNVQIALSDLNVCGPGAPAFNPQSDIDRAAANGDIRRAADDRDVCVRLQKIDPHRTFNARDRKIAFAAVDLE